MKYQLALATRTIEYTLKTSLRSRSVRLSVYGDGDVRVSAPKWLGQSTIEKFIIQKSDWIVRKIDHFARRGPMICLKSGAADYRTHRDRALVIAEKKVLQWNAFYRFDVHNITVRNQKSCWGSCSTKGNLSFNYKIVHLPENLVDYIVVHELCHLGQFNHSVRFWNLVAQTIPDYKERRKELKQYIS